jgi:hypothetical protein
MLLMPRFLGTYDFPVHERRFNFALSSCYWMFPAVILGEATVEEAQDMGVVGGPGALRIGVEVMVAVVEEEEDMQAIRGI